MNSHRLFTALAIAVTCWMGAGCSSYNKDINDVTGVTEEELKKSMEGAASDGPHVIETTAEETMALLTDPEVGTAAAEALKATKRRLLGKVLEISPEGSETPFVVLDGGTHNNQACKIKCLFAKSQAESVKEAKVGSDIKITGSSDAVITSGVLEMKDCTFDSAAPAKASTPKP